MQYENYVLDCLKQGKLLDIKSYTDYWHQNDCGVSLKNFIGFTEAEMDQWIRVGNSILPDILKQRAALLGVPFPAETSAGVRATASVVYRKVYYRIKCPAYQFDRGFLSEQGEAAFKEESRSLFQRDGWELLPERSSGASDTFTRGKERLYLHPMSYSGEVLEENISAVERLLASAKTFSCYATDLYESYLDLSPQSLRESLEAQREEIAADLLEAFRTPQRNQYHYDGKPLRQMIKKYGVLLIDERDLTGKTAGNVVSGIFFDLVKQQKILTKNRRYQVGFRTATPKDQCKTGSKKTA
ncbi:hypothetical protein [Anaerotruncus rubiinfantis]|uniref:hypothetical protein n=1 Tax=Anaerotruncus rubiinfantis TaxID=1720200 RepID=UPI003D7BF080